MSRLRFLLTRNDSGAWGSDEAEPGTLVTAVWRSTDVDAQGRWISGSEPAQRHLSASDRRACAVERGDLLVTKASGSPRHIGKTALVGEDRVGDCFSNFVQRLSVGPRTAPKYLWYLLNSRIARRHYSLYATTTTGLKNLNGSLAKPPVSTEAGEFQARCERRLGVARALSQPHSCREGRPHQPRPHG